MLTARLNAWAVDIGVRPWVTVDAYTRITGDLNRDLLAAFRDRHIEIPFPQREVRLLGAQ